jgi:hypothetical protein
MFHAFMSCIENTFDKQIYNMKRNLCDIRSFIGSYFICQHIYPCVKYVFNTWYSCVKCKNLWMDELCTIFIINLSHVKFVMVVQYVLCNLHITLLKLVEPFMYYNI